MTEADETASPENQASPEPGPRTVACEKCGRSVAVEDVTTARGKFYCPECVDGTIAMESVLPFREKFDNRAIKWTVLGCGVLLVAAVFVTIFVLVYTYMRFDTQLDCRTRMKTLYSRMATYAREYNGYPPRNNDLRPLMDEGTMAKVARTDRANFALFVCPGTTNIVTRIAHLQDNGTAPDGEGMSYFYQGGHGFVIEPGDEALPLLWDQGPANHKGRGVNVIFKDGHHRCESDGAPELRPPGQGGAGAD